MGRGTNGAVREGPRVRASLDIKPSLGGRGIVMIGFTEPTTTLPAIGVKTGARGLSLKRGEVGAGLNTGARGFKSECTANGKDLLAFLATSTLRQLFDQGAQEFT